LLTIYLLPARREIASDPRKAPQEGTRIVVTISVQRLDVREMEQIDDDEKAAATTRYLYPA